MHKKMKLTPGVWPTMITAFTEDGKLDFKANMQIADHLINLGADGIFTVCQSSEMFFLSLQEKIDLATCVLEAAEGRVPVIASGHTSENKDQQIIELSKIADTGVDAVVMVLNRLVDNNQDKDILFQNLSYILNTLPDVTFGMYECPYPYLRLLSDDEFTEMANNPRIEFLKDVSCNKLIQEKRAGLAKDTNLKLYNAETASISNSFSYDYTGYNGVMGNYHIDIYKWYYENRIINPEMAIEVQEWLTWAYTVHQGSYPVSAKYHMNLEGVKCSLHTRMKKEETLTKSLKKDIQDLQVSEDELRKELGIK